MAKYLSIALILWMSMQPTVVELAAAQAPAKLSRVPYADVQLSWGVLTGATAQIVAIQEECAKRFLELRPRVDSTFSAWKARNSYMDRAKEAVYQRAIREGGEAEAIRLSNELAAAHKANEGRVRAYAQQLSKEGCADFMIKLDSGVFDPRTRYKEHLQTVLGTLP